MLFGSKQWLFGDVSFSFDMFFSSMDVLCVWFIENTSVGHQIFKMIIGPSVLEREISKIDEDNGEEEKDERR